jgi:ABC-2 type transport system ATP-binding protein
MPEKILEIDGLYKALKDKTVLHNVTFHVNKGEILGIMGKSGTGKTTLLRLLVGFLKPDQGLIYYKGKELKDNLKFLQSEVGFLTQEDCFYDELTVLENLYYFGRMFNVKKNNIKISSERLLSFLKLSEKKDTLVQHLSGGMKRRLDFACAMIHNPEIIIMDEPTTGLDPILRREFWRYIRFMKHMGKTIIFSSHQLEELESLCDSVVIIDDGKIKEFGSVNEIKEKYEKSYEINLRTTPGNYQKIVSNFKKEHINIKRFKQYRHTLIIFTSNPHDALKELIPILDNLNEELIEVEVRRPSLNEVFEFYVGDNTN